MSRTKIGSLTPSQESALVAYRDEQLAWGRCTQPAAREATERVLKEMYQALGQQEPRIWWCDGPAVGSIVRSLMSGDAGANLDDNLGANLRDNLDDNLGANLGANLRANLRANLGANLWANLRANLDDNLGANLDDNLRANLRANLWANLRANLRANLWANLGVNLGGNLDDNLDDNLRANLDDNLRANLRANLWANLRANLSWRFWGQHELAWSAFYAWSHLALRPMHTAEQMHRLEWWLTLNKSCGWWNPYANIVFVCERPMRQAVDAQGRLHHETDAALLCRDGWPVYAWHGVRVPELVITHPDGITSNQILDERNAEVSRVMMERMGLERFYEQAGAKILNSDSDRANMKRELVQIDLPNDPERLLRMVRVICPSTGHSYMLRVPPTVQTCAEAVAWTFGQSPEAYAPLVEA